MNDFVGRRAGAVVPPKYVVPRPECVLLFGGSSRFTPSLVRQLQAMAPETEIRIATSRPKSRAALEDRYPGANVVAADFFDVASLRTALRGVHSAFVVTPSFFDESRGMGCLIAAMQEASTLRHVIRIVGDPPGMRHARVPRKLKDYGGGTAIQHLLAREMFEASGLPVTYLNMAASYMDNFHRAATQFRAGYWLMPTDRLIGYVDPRDVGEAAARILMSGDCRYLFQHFNVDNGERPWRSSELVEVISDVLGQRIELLVSPERFIAEVGPLLNRRYGRNDGGQYMVDMLEFEEDNELTWRGSDFLESILGRRPTTVREWLVENRASLRTCIARDDGQ